MIRSIGRPLLSLKSRSRHAAACGRISSFGYHLNGSDTRSAAMPRARSSLTNCSTSSSAPPRTRGTCVSQTSAVRTCILGGVAEVDDVPVLHDVLLAFQPHLAMLLARRHRSAHGERVVGYDLGADEAALNIAVNLA